MYEIVAHNSLSLSLSPPPPLALGRLKAHCWTAVRIMHEDIWRVHYIMCKVIPAYCDRKDECEWLLVSGGHILMRLGRIKCSKIHFSRFRQHGVSIQVHTQRFRWLSIQLNVFKMYCVCRYSFFFLLIDKECVLTRWRLSRRKQKIIYKTNQYRLNSEVTFKLYPS